NELKEYYMDGLVKREVIGDDSLAWWVSQANSTRNSFPTLTKTAFDLFSMPAISAECERTFSQASKTPRTPSPPQEMPLQTVVETPSTARALRNLAMKLVDDDWLDLNNIAIGKFLKGNRKRSEARNLALDHLSRTQAAEKHANNARSVKTNRAQKEEATATHGAEKEQQQDGDIEDNIVVYMKQSLSVFKRGW
ncbi:hypothetical protein B0A49_09468, partial [Cryomyces minteri]